MICKGCPWRLAETCRACRDGEHITISGDEIDAAVARFEASWESKDPPVWYRLPTNKIGGTE